MTKLKLLWVTTEQYRQLTAESYGSRDDFYRLKRQIETQSIEGTWLKREDFMEICLKADIPGLKIRELREKIFGRSLDEIQSNCTPD